MSINIDEILNKCIVGNITYATMLKNYLGKDKYEQELPKIKKMDSKEFIDYFEEALDREENIRL